MSGPSDCASRTFLTPFNIHHIDDLARPRPYPATIAQGLTGTPIPTRVPLHEIYFRQHGHRLIDPKQKDLPRDLREISPSELLQAKYAVVPYADVTGMAAELLDWCTAGPRPTAGRLIHGPGGLGKTRLMIHVAAQLRDQHGWTAGFLDRPHDVATPSSGSAGRRWSSSSTTATIAGLLLVLDYAEGRQDELLRLARRLGERTGDAMPARSASSSSPAAPANGGNVWSRSSPTWSGWCACPAASWTALRSTASALGTARQRLDLFEAAAAPSRPCSRRKATCRPGPTAPERLRRLDTNDDYERPLAVQIEALLWLTSAAPAAGLQSASTELLDRLLGLERAHWQKLLERSTMTASATSPAASVRSRWSRACDSLGRPPNCC